MDSQRSRNVEPLDRAEILKMADEIARAVDGGHHKAYGTNPHQTTMTAGNAWWRTVADAMRAFAGSESRATDLLREVRPYLDLISPTVSTRERPLVMVTTACDAEALAKRIDTFLGEPK